MGGCETCTIGNRNCDGGGGDPGDNSTMVLVLALGADEVNTAGRDIMDIVDLEYGSYCDPLSNFKFKATYGVGEYTHDKFIYCGGYSTSIQSPGDRSECYFYDEDTLQWNNFGNLSQPKYLHASVVLPNGDMWVTGGYDQINQALDSTDIVKPDLRVIPGPDLPGRNHDHCMVQWNVTHTMLIGGIDSPTEYWFYDWSKGNWTLGGSLLFTSTLNGCTKVQGEDGDKVYVMGGIYAASMTQVFDGSGWSYGPGLPDSFFFARAVTYENSIYLTGGNNYNDFAWRLDLSTSIWSPAFEMSPPITNHDMFLVPERFCEDTPM